MGPMPDYTSAAMLSQQPQPAPKPSGGMFGGGGKFGLKEALAFGLAGLVSRQNPMLLQGLMGAVMQRQKSQQEDQQYQQRRGDQFTDFQREYDYKMAHPQPANNDTAADYDYISQHLGKVAADRFLQTKTNPIVMTPYGPMPYSAVNGGSAPPQAPVGKLTPLNDGGPASPAPAPFPRPYY
jgi:hypothetical protein